MSPREPPAGFWEYCPGVCDASLHQAPAAAGTRPAPGRGGASQAASWGAQRLRQGLCSSLISYACLLEAARLLVSSAPRPSRRRVSEKRSQGCGKRHSSREAELWRNFEPASAGSRGKGAVSRPIFLSHPHSKGFPYCFIPRVGTLTHKLQDSFLGASHILSKVSATVLFRHYTDLAPTWVTGRR